MKNQKISEFKEILKKFKFCVNSKLEGGRGGETVIADSVMGTFWRP